MDRERLQMRAARLARLVELDAPSLIVRAEVRLVMLSVGPRWLADLWFDIVTWNTKNLFRRSRARLVDLVTWRACENCGRQVWQQRKWEHAIAHEPQELPDDVRRRLN